MQQRLVYPVGVVIFPRGIDVTRVLVIAFRLR